MASFIFSIFSSMALMAACCLSFSLSCSSCSFFATNRSSSLSLAFISSAAFLPMSFRSGPSLSTYSLIAFLALASSSLHSWMTRLLSAVMSSTSLLMVLTKVARLRSKMAFTSGRSSIPSSQSLAFLAQPKKPE